MAPTDIAARAAAESDAHHASGMNSIDILGDALLYEASEIRTLTRTISECQRSLLFNFRTSLHINSTEILY